MAVWWYTAEQALTGAWQQFAELRSENMAIPGALMDEISQFVKVDRDTLISRGIASLLKETKCLVLLERLQLLARHGVRGREELERAIQEASVEEHPTWEDVIVLENLDAEIARIDAYLKTL
jgi:hypothetical protein